MPTKKERSNANVLKGYFYFICFMIVLSIIFRDKLVMIYENPQIVKDFISSAGIFGPFVLILMQTCQVIIFVVPGPVFTIAGGYAFGILWGFIYSLIGTLLGSIVVFMLARIYGRPFVEKMVDKDDLKKYDKFFKEKGKLSLFITRTMPILFPNDAISFAAGLTPLTLFDYAWISFVGFIPNIFVLTYFGDMMYTNMNPTFLLLLAIIGFTILGIMWRKPLGYMFKRLKQKWIRRLHG